METCKHEGPHYRVNPKGQPGVFWCEQCIRESGVEGPDQNLKTLCTILQGWTKERRELKD